MAHSTALPQLLSVTPAALPVTVLTRGLDAPPPTAARAASAYDAATAGGGVSELKAGLRQPLPSAVGPKLALALRFVSPPPPPQPPPPQPPPPQTSAPSGARKVLLHDGLHLLWRLWQ